MNTKHTNIAAPTGNPLLTLVGHAVVAASAWTVAAVSRGVERIGKRVGEKAAGVASSASAKVREDLDRAREI